LEEENNKSDEIKSIAGQNHYNWRSGLYELKYTGKNFSCFWDRSSWKDSSHD
jgi:hypothetical protein